MIVAMLDTNVLASGFIGLNKPDSAPGALLRRWREGQFALVVSDPILVELARVFTYPYFVHRLSAAEIEAAIVELRNVPTRQPLSDPLPGEIHSDADELVLATTIVAQADYLVTGDKPLLDRGALLGVPVLTPKQFLEILVEQESG